jgi:hypothetical protein
MNRDEITRMARESGLHLDGENTQKPLWVATTEEIERFAALATAAERNKLAAWMMAQGYATGHGDSMEDLLKELTWQIHEDRARNESE